MDIMLERVLSLIGDKRGAIKPLAEFLNISGNNISDWKSGKNKSYRQYAPKIAEYYGVSLDWLCGLSDEKTPKEKPDTQTSTELSPLDVQLIQMLPRMTEQEKKIFLAQIKAVIASRGQ
ncbi:MAG: hypothetical protein GX488_09280 [Clostridiales bacterium]|nr:hypothetical protein [Clostridiales bacterium]